jgi:hypothetical protein
MDRFSVRRSAGNIVVDTANILQQDSSQDAWAHAVVTIA